MMKIYFYALLMVFGYHTSIPVLNAQSKTEQWPINPEGISDFARWSPDGSKIAFQSNRDGNFEIYVMDADGSDLKRLTKNYYNDQFPTWSPDGKRIAFSSMATGGTHMVPGSSAIFVIDADGQNLKRITNKGAGDDRPTPIFNDIYPVWSPKGDKIAFLSDRANGWREIYWANPDGTDVIQLTFHRSHHWNLVWTPDGKRIVFDFRKDGFAFVGNTAKWGAYSVRVDDGFYTWGDDLQVLINKEDTELEGDCVISPDGKTLGFHVWHIVKESPEKRRGDGGIYMTELENVNGRISVKGEVTHIQAGKSVNSPNWSPDGKKIIFTSAREGHSEIFSMNPDGTEVKRLTFSREQ